MNANIHDFQGMLNIKPWLHTREALMDCKIGVDNFLLRGCSLQGDRSVIVIVVRTGEETKMFQHLQKGEALTGEMKDGKC